MYPDESYEQYNAASDDDSDVDAGYEGFWDTTEGRGEARVDEEANDQKQLKKERWISQRPPPEPFDVLRPSDPSPSTSRSEDAYYGARPMLQTANSQQSVESHSDDGNAWLSRSGSAATSTDDVLKLTHGASLRTPESMGLGMSPQKRLGQRSRHSAQELLRLQEKRPFMSQLEVQSQPPVKAAEGQAQTQAQTQAQPQVQPQPSPIPPDDIKERLEWQHMLSNVLEGDVLRSEKSRIEADVLSKPAVLTLMGPDHYYGRSTAVRQQRAYLIWLLLRAKMHNVSANEEAIFVKDARTKFGKLLEDIMKFKVVYDTPLPDPSTPAVHPSVRAGLSRRIHEGHAQIAQLIAQFDWYLELWPSLKACYLDYPQVRDPGISTRIDALRSWLSLYEQLSTTVDLLEKWSGPDWHLLSNLDVSSASDSISSSAAHSRRQSDSRKNSDPTPTAVGAAAAAAAAAEDEHAQDNNTHTPPAPPQRIVMVERLIREGNLQAVFSKKVFLAVPKMLDTAHDALIRYRYQYIDMAMPSFIALTDPLFCVPVRLINEVLQAQLSSANEILSKAGDTYLSDAKDILMLEQTTNSFRKTLEAVADELPQYMRIAAASEIPLDLYVLSAIDITVSQIHEAASAAAETTGAATAVVAQHQSAHEDSAPQDLTVLANVVRANVVQAVSASTTQAMLTQQREKRRAQLSNATNSARASASASPADNDNDNTAQHSGANPSSSSTRVVSWSLWLVPPALIEPEKTLRYVLKVFLALLQKKLFIKGQSSHFAETELVEGEWGFLRRLSPLVENGEIITADFFSYMTYKLIDRVSDYFLEQLHIAETKAMSNAALIQFINRVVDNVRVRHGRLMRFSRRLASHVANAAEYSLSNIDTSRLVRALAASGHILVLCDAAQYHGIAIFADPTLTGHPDRIASLFTRINMSSLVPQRLAPHTSRTATTSPSLQSPSSPPLGPNVSSAPPTLNTYFAGPSASPSAHNSNSNNNLAYTPSGHSPSEAHPLESLSTPDAAAEAALLATQLVPSTLYVPPTGDPNDQDADYVHLPQYLIVTSAEDDFLWTGDHMRAPIGPRDDLDLPLNRLRLIADGSQERLEWVKGYFTEMLPAFKKNCLNGQLSHLSRTFIKNQRRTRKSTYRLSRTIFAIMPRVRSLAQSTNNQIAELTIVTHCYAFAAGIGQRVARDLDAPLRLKLESLLRSFTVDWIQLVSDYCIPSDPRTFRYVVQALEFAKYVSRGDAVRLFPPQDFQRLQHKVASCMTLLISHFDILGARSTSQAHAAGTEQQLVQSAAATDERALEHVNKHVAVSASNQGTARGSGSGSARAPSMSPQASTLSNAADAAPAVYSSQYDGDEGEFQLEQDIASSQQDASDYEPTFRLPTPPPLLSSSNAPYQHSQQASDEARFLYTQQRRANAVRLVDARRRALDNQLYTPGKVIDHEKPENRALVLLAASSANIAIQWQRDEHVGSGTFGSVYLAHNTETGHQLAVKEIIIHNVGSAPNLVQTILDEMTVMEMLKHPNVVEYYGVEVHRDRVFIFEEYCAGGSLSALLSHGRIEDEFVLQIYTTQLLHGLIYLHSQNVVHRDIKPDNILLDKEGVIKYVDFGAAKVLARRKNASRNRHNNDHTALAADPVSPASSPDASNTPVNSLIGTPMYLAPEVVRGEKDTPMGSMDVWALGCVVLECATGHKPWAHLDNEFAIMYNIGIATKHPPLPDPSQLSELGIDFIRQSLIIDPHERPTALELLNHPWLVQLVHELEKLEQRDLERREEGVVSAESVEAVLKDGALAATRSR